MYSYVLPKDGYATEGHPFHPLMFYQDKRNLLYKTRFITFLSNWMDFNFIKIHPDPGWLDVQLYIIVTLSLFERGNFSLLICKRKEGSVDHLPSCRESLFSSVTVLLSL
jgi:hypothetical protein